MGLSSNILWHQSNKVALKRILKTKAFFFSYARETVPGLSFPVFFPMISLCDIPFSEISEYLEKYDGYSIGIARDWGISNGFNPVWYCENDSTIQKNLVKFFAEAIKEEHPASEKIAAMKTFSYMKRVEGPLESRKYEKYRFYNEREFRLVYEFEDAQKKGFPPILAGDEALLNYKKEHKDTKFLLKDNKATGKKFEWSDIKYIIVKEVDEVHEIKQYLKGLGCTNDNILFFDHEQIKHDILGVSHDKKVAPAIHADETIEVVLDE